MGTNSEAMVRPARNVNRLAQSLNAGLAVVVARSLYPSTSLEIRIQHALNRFFGLHRYSKVGGYASTFGMAIVIALVSFVLLRLLSYLAPKRHMLYCAGGVLSLALQPVCWLYFSEVRGLDPLGSAINVALFLELGVASACTLLYLNSKWPILRSLCIALAVVHFGLWYWFFVGRSFHFQLIMLTFPIVALSCFLAWVKYGSSQKADRKAAG